MKPDSSWKRTTEFFDDLQDYSSPKEGLSPEDFWPTLRQGLQDGSLIEKNGSIAFLQKFHD